MLYDIKRRAWVNFVRGFKFKELDKNSVCSILEQVENEGDK
jgi:hypothetical protein